MFDPYCGKNCDTCAKKTNLECPGCQFGPGKPGTGTCEVAKCCHRKKLISCEYCGEKETCSLLLDKDVLAKARERETEKEKTRRREEVSAHAAELTERSMILGTWLPRIFVVLMVAVVIKTVFHLLDTVIDTHSIEDVFDCVCLLLLGFFYLKMSSVEEKYRQAGIWNLAMAAVALISFSTFSGFGIWAELLAVVVAYGIRLISDYYEYMGCAAVLADVNSELGQKWKKLWRWNLIGRSVLVGVEILEIGLLELIRGMWDTSVLSDLFAAGFASLLMIMAVIVRILQIALIVEEVFMLIYTKRTANIFVEYKEYGC